MGPGLALAGCLLFGPAEVWQAAIYVAFYVVLVHACAGVALG
jgi:hypothetical protein